MASAGDRGDLLQSRSRFARFGGRFAFWGQVTSPWQQRLVALSSPTGALYVVTVFTPFGRKAAQLSVLVVCAAHQVAGYPMDALVG